MTQPKITAKDVHDAAVTLERMSKLYGMDAKLGEWCADDLRSELPHIEELEEQQRIRSEVVKAVVTHVYAGLDVEDAVIKALEGYELALAEEY